MTVSCAFCNGTGVQPHSLKMACLACRGKGKVEFEHAAIVCPACKGSGRLSGFSVLSCMQCRGVGMVAKEQEIGMIEKAENVLKVQRAGSIIKDIFRRIAKGLFVSADWMKIQLSREILWYKTIVNKIKRHS